MAHKGTQVTRRSMLQMSASTLTVAGVAAISGHWQILKRNLLRVQDVDSETFLAYIGKTLRFVPSKQAHSLSSATVDLILTAVTAHEDISRHESQKPSMYGRRQRQSFSLLFQQQGGKPLEAGIHRLVHADFEDFEVFLSPVGMPRSDGRRHLEAIFG
jgi:hypothetical protein